MTGHRQRRRIARLMTLWVVAVIPSCDLLELPPLPARWPEGCLDYGQFHHLVGSVSTPHRASALGVSGDYAYVAAGDALYVIDISRSSSPVIAGNIDLPGGTDFRDSARFIALAGAWALVGGDGSSIIYVVDISNPTVPSIAGNIRLPGPPQDLTLDGSYAYIAAGEVRNQGAERRAGAPG